MEINFIRKKEPATDVVIVKCKIKRLVIPAGTVDPGANFPIMSEDISKRSKLVIDTKENMISEALLLLLQNRLELLEISQ